MCTVVIGSVLGNIEETAMGDQLFEFFLTIAMPILQQLLGERLAALDQVVEAVKEAALAAFLAAPQLLAVESITGQAQAGACQFL